MKKAEDEVPGDGYFYDYAEGDTVWEQDLTGGCPQQSRWSGLRFERQMIRSKALSHQSNLNTH